MRVSLVYRLLRSLYEFKQLVRLWNQNVIAFYKRIGFRQLNGDPSILIQQSSNETSLVSVYIDNFLIASNTMTTLKVIKAFLSNKYDVKDFSKVKQS